MHIFLRAANIEIGQAQGDRLSLFQMGGALLQ
jgi:hypothetical protein